MITLLEYIEQENISTNIKRLRYSLKELAPVISEETMEYHYNNLAKTYAKRLKAGEGDPDFNSAGVFLHNVLFEQYKNPQTNNSPTGEILQFIESKFKSFKQFKDEFTKGCMSIQGSGWCYISTRGEIKTIKNHVIKKDILLLVDMWEHAWALDYKWKKKDYIDNQWNIIDWDVIQSRLEQR